MASLGLLSLHGSGLFRARVFVRVRVYLWLLSVYGYCIFMARVYVGVIVSLCLGYI